MNPDAPQATPTTQPESNSDIPGLVHGGANQETSTAATNPGAEIPTQTSPTVNTSAGNTEVGSPSAVSPSEFRATPTAGKGPFANEQATSNASATTPSAEIPTQSPETTNAATTPAAAPGLEETPKPIENPTQQTNEQPAPPTPEAPAATQDTPTQIDASGVAQAPTENASTDFSETPTEQAGSDNQVATQTDQAQDEANAAAAMHIKKAPINLEPQEFSQEAETDNSTFASIEEVNTEAARGFAQIKGTHYEEPFLKGYSEAVKEALIHSKKSD